MEVFGAVAAGCALGGELLRLSRALRKMIRSVKYARREIVNLSDEIDMFAALYQSLKTTYDRKRNEEGSICTSFPMKKLTSWTESVKRSFEALLGKVEALSYDPEYVSMIGTVAAHAKWYFERNTVICLRASLSVARESITGFLNVVQIESLDEQLKLLQEALRSGNRRAIEQRLGMTIERAIEDTEQARDNCREQRLNTARRLQRHKDTVIESQSDKDRNNPLVPDIDRLFSYTGRVERCIDNVVPRRPQRPLHLSSSQPPSSPEPPSSISISTSHATSSMESTTSSARSRRRRARTGPQGDRAVPLQNQTMPSTSAAQVQRDEVQPASRPSIRRDGDMIWIDGYGVTVNEGASVDKFMRDIGNDIDKLTQFAEGLRGIRTGQRSGPMQIGTWTLLG